MTKVKELNAAIDVSQANNIGNPYATLMANTYGSKRPAASTPEPQRQTSGPTSLRAALQQAMPGDADELRSFATYLGGDMTALADLRPSGDGGVFIPSSLPAS